ncbi:hypothetical protein JNE51_004430 [Salmonella enterica]|nr:hypothetical protein [Salmonella enterica]
MGLFGGVSQADYDSLNNDFKVLRFTHNMEEMKATQALIYADMIHHLGKAAGVINTINALIESEMTATAKNVFELMESEIVENVNRANASHKQILDSMATFSPEINRAYINHLCTTQGEAQPLHERVNSSNDFLIATIKLFNSLQQMFS